MAPDGLRDEPVPGAPLSKRVVGCDRGRILLACCVRGLDPDGAYWRDLLRVLPSGQEFQASGTRSHRDTWASSPDAQTNWWTPIYPVTDERTITFAPTYWSAPVANSSVDWGPGSTRLIPEPREILDPFEARIVVDPGDLLCFSGAQLHSTVPNDTGRARFSVEVRTISRTDLRDHHGATPVDTTAPVPRYGWFYHVLDGRRLSGPPPDND